MGVRSPRYTLRAYVDKIVDEFVERDKQGPMIQNSQNMAERLASFSHCLQLRRSVGNLFVLIAPRPNKRTFDTCGAWECRRGVQKSAPPDCRTFTTNIVGTRLLKTKNDGTRLNPTALGCTRVHWSSPEST